MRLSERWRYVYWLRMRHGLILIHLEKESSKSFVSDLQKHDCYEKDTIVCDGFSFPMLDLGGIKGKPVEKRHQMELTFHKT